MDDTFNEPLIPSQVSDLPKCSICYELLTTMDRYSLHGTNQHEFHKQCIVDYFKVVIDNN